MHLCPSSLSIPYCVPVSQTFHCISYPFSVYPYPTHPCISCPSFVSIPYIPVPPLYLYPIYLSLLCIYTLYTCPSSVSTYSCPSSVSIPYIRAVSPDCVGGRGKVGLAGPVWAAPNLIIILIPGMPHASSPGYLSRYTQLSPPVSSPVASYTQLPINPRKLSCSQLHGYHPLKLSCSQLSPAAQLSPPVSSPVTSYTQLSTPESSPVASYTAITP